MFRTSETPAELLEMSNNSSNCISMNAFCIPFSLTCEVAEDTEGDGEAGGVRRLQGRLRVT